MFFESKFLYQEKPGESLDSVPRVESQGVSPEKQKEVIGNSLSKVNSFKGKMEEFISDSDFLSNADKKELQTFLDGEDFVYVLDLSEKVLNDPSYDFTLSDLNKVDSVFTVASKIEMNLELRNYSALQGEINGKRVLFYKNIKVFKTDLSQEIRFIGDGKFSLGDQGMITFQKNGVLIVNSPETDQYFVMNADEETGKLTIAEVNSDLKSIKEGGRHRELFLKKPESKNPYSKNVKKVDSVKKDEGVSESIDDEKLKEFNDIVPDDLKDRVRFETKGNDVIMYVKTRTEYEVSFSSELKVTKVMSGNYDISDGKTSVNLDISTNGFRFIHETEDGDMIKSYDLH